MSKEDFQMCERDNCKLCEKLNELGKLIQDRYEYSKEIREKLAECFCH